MECHDSIVQLLPLLLLSVRLLLLLPPLPPLLLRLRLAGVILFETRQITVADNSLACIVMLASLLRDILGFFMWMFVRGIASYTSLATCLWHTRGVP